MSVWHWKSTHRHSLLAQSLLANLLPVAASAATVLIVVAILLFAQKKAFDLETGFRAKSVAKLVAQQAELGLVTADKWELDRITRNTLRIDDVIYAAVVSPAGEVLSTAHRPEFRPGDTSQSNYVNAAAPIVPFGDASPYEWEVPKEQTTSPAMVRIAVSTEAQRVRLQQTLAMVLLVSFSGLFGLGLILTVQQRSTRKVLAPLKDLTAFTRLLAGGDLTQRTEIVRDDEVGQLAQASNEMAERLETSRRELMDAVKDAKEANRLKGEFLANMSHEIRTPLNGVLGMIDLALDGELNGEQRDYLSTATTSAHSLLTVLNDILDFSKIEAGKLEMAQAPFDLISEVDHLGKAYAVHAHRKGVELVCRIAPGTPTALLGDAGRLRQVLQNLLSNAFKFTAAGEVFLNVSLDEEKGANGVRLKFDVHDSGIGIPEESHQNIFEAFRQVDGSTTRLYGGTGLGLAICSKLVTLMGGSLYLRSAPGSGSTFSFCVPFEITGAVPLSPSPFEMHLPNGLPVLVVANSPANLLVLGETLKGWDADVTLLSSAREALATARLACADGRPFRLVIMDRVLGGSDGFVLAEQIRSESQPTPPVIVMTTLTDLGAATRCLGLPGVSCIVKPVSARDLRSAIRRALPRSAERRLAARLPNASGTEPAQSLRVLLVEDNAVNQKLAMRLLERAGHNVEVAWDGVEAMAALSARNFDCVLMDVQMPRMDGFEATRALRKLEAATGDHTRVVAMTAHALDGDRERCLEAGMDDYMPKPISRVNLLKILEPAASRQDITI